MESPVFTITREREMINCLMEAFYKSWILSQNREEDEKQIVTIFTRLPSCHVRGLWGVLPRFGSNCGDTQGSQGAMVEPFLYTYLIEIHAQKDNIIIFILPIKASRLETKNS